MMNDQMTNEQLSSSPFQTNGDLGGKIVKVAALFVAACVGCFLLGAVNYVAQWIPLVITGVLAPACYGALAGYCAAQICRFCSVKSLGVFIGLSMMLGVVCIYGSWFWFSRFMLDVTIKPLDVWEVMKEVSEVRTITFGSVGRHSSSSGITGGFLLACYVVELLLIVGFSVGLAIADWLGGFFCPKCSKWGRGTWNSEFFVPASPLDLQRLEAGDLSALDNCRMADVFEEEHYSINMVYCQDCYRGKCRIVSHQKSTLNKKGEVTVGTATNGWYVELEPSAVTRALAFNNQLEAQTLAAEGDAPTGEDDGESTGNANED